ncbi:hypothetical protein AVEN_170204-1 [Araneus ventricosus]|uniref:Uncharacterized protein n=1 Tax=Araneus ventricosus TaxID=182803 RepID=A0A4Y2KWS7_ARAVE|nr:hypothetical protein AVEN_170204-1 [Araneus ventricosus]
MESRFPTMLVLVREFYRGMYGNAGEMEPSTHDLGEHFGDKFGDFGDELWDLKNTGIFLIFLLEAEIRIYTDDSCDITACREDYK